MFTELTTRYIELKYSVAATRDDWNTLAQSAASAIKSIKADKEAVYRDGPKVHGVRQQSRLDVLDEREFRMCALFDNASDMAHRSIK